MKDKKKKIKHSSLRRKLTITMVVNYILLGTFILTTVSGLFFYNVVRSRYSDNIDMSRTIKDTITSQLDISELVDAVLEQERPDPEAFRERMFVNEAGDEEGQILSYQWFTEEDPSLAQREDYRCVSDVLYAFNSNNQNLNGTSLMVFDKKTHIASLLCDVEKFGSHTPTKVDYVMWRNFKDEDLDHIEEERYSLFKNLYRYMRVDPRYVVFIWYEPVAYKDDDVVVFIEADVFYTRLLSNVVSFILLFFFFILLLVTLMGFLYHGRLNRLIIKPVNSITDAAKTYVEDHLAGRGIKGHFSSIDLNSGDEFEELARTMDEMEHDIEKFENDLTRITAERERLSAELDVASRIQADMLPKDFPLFPERNEFDLYASMRPAKEIGGDFYDVFLMDDDHLCIVMADVAGKGVPAALFMVNAMKTIRARASYGGTPSEIFFDVNNTLFKGNKEKIFVTVWMAVLDLNTGEVIESNAGHENPAVRGPVGDFSYIERKHCFVLGGRKNMKYKDDAFTLEPGGTIFIYTDGVTEATNASGERFYNDRLLEALNAVKYKEPKEMISYMKDKIDEFVDEAPQFDDLTMLAVTYHGDNAKDNEITVKADVANLPEVTAFVTERLETVPVERKLVLKIGMVIDELFTNVSNYGYGEEKGDLTVRVAIASDKSKVTLTFIDSGVPYDPLAKEDPNITRIKEGRKPGGLGIFMVKKTMDEMEYDYKNGHNIFTVSKMIGGEK